MYICVILYDFIWEIYSNFAFKVSCKHHFNSYIIPHQAMIHLNLNRFIGHWNCLRWNCLQSVTIINLTTVMNILMNKLCLYLFYGSLEWILRSGITRLMPMNISNIFYYILQNCLPKNGYQHHCFVTTVRHLKHSLFSDLGKWLSSLQRALDLFWQEECKGKETFYIALSVI